MNKILNINDYKNIVYSLVGNEYTVLSEHYVDSSTKLEMIHNYCGHKFKVTPYTNSDRKLRNIIFNICNTNGYTQYLITEGNAHKPRYLV